MLLFCFWRLQKNYAEKIIRKFFTICAVFHDFSYENLEYLNSCAIYKNYKKDEIVLSYGTKAKYFNVIVSGWLKIFRTTPDGHELIIDLYSKGNCFSKTSSLKENSIYHYDVSTIEPTTIMKIPAIKIRELLKKNNHLALSVIEMLSSHIAELELQLEHQVVMNAKQKVGCFLMRLALEDQNGKKVISLPTNKTLIALKLGMQRETFSRTLEQLSKTGLKVKGRNVTIDNIESLRKHTCINCSKAGACKIFKNSN